MAAEASRSKPPVWRRVVVGTAGHIDHGKTELVKALTGIDCDRWAEEKERGITIDIGFAHLTEGDLQVGFVDVPGHERFLHNALAGLGGIRVALLVVAATEGVMPQTREHLAVCSLLGIPSAIVALTKVDLVEVDLAELAELEIEEFLDRTPYRGSPIIRVSAVTGEGIDGFRRALIDLASEHVIEGSPQDPVRLPVDRAFHLRGLGTIVTGTLVSGVIEQGDRLELLPSGETLQIRNIQIHGENRSYASAGERTSLQVTGAGLEKLSRGLQLVTPGAFRSTTQLCARFEHLEDSPIEIGQAVEIRLHLFSSEVVGTLRPLRPRRIQPGADGIVQIRLRDPVVALRGDRIVVRRTSPATTIGGGTLLDSDWSRPRRRGLAEALDALSGPTEEAICFWIDTAGAAGMTTQELRPRLALRSELQSRILTELVESGRLLEISADQGDACRWISSRIFDQVAGRAAQALEGFFTQNRLAVGMPKAQLIEHILPELSARLADYYLGSLDRRGVLHVKDGVVTLPGRKVELSQAEARAAERLLDAIEQGGLAPPEDDRLREMVVADLPGAFDAAVKYLLATGKLVRLPNRALVSAAAIQQMQSALLDSGVERLTVPEFKDRFHLTRKWAIPLLEHLDSVGFTRRAGDLRLISRQGH